MKRLKYFALAALVAFAACEEGNESVVPEPDTGTISGTVTVDGIGLAGVTVTLTPTGATTTTAANGDYSFSDVEAGAYTVAISGTPSDAAFSTTSKAAVITTDGQVIDVDFSGSYIRTSAISASVSVPGVGAIAGATVSISGMESASQVTGASGTATFSGLRAGAYTVSAALGAAAAALYDLNVNSFNVQLDVDELEAVAFVATPKTISTITGRMYIDEVSKNNQYDPANEENLTIADVDIVIEGVSVGVFDTIQTDANGEYELNGLPAANYRISLDTSPFNGAVSLGTPNDVVITLGVADTEVVDFGFDIIEQRIVIGAFLGADEDNGPSGVPSRVEEIPGVDIDLYTTAQAANNAPGAGFLDDANTGSSGLTTITFDRADDTDPFGGPSDNVVFAIVGGLPAAFAGLVQNGEGVIEVPFPAKDSIVTSDDVFDYLNSSVTISFLAQETDGDTYANVGTRLETDTTVFTASVANTDAAGMVYYDLTATGTYYARVRTEIWPAFVANDDIPFPPNGVLPLTYPFTQTPNPAAPSADDAGSWLEFEYDGTSLPTDTVFIGHNDINWDNVRLRGRAYREANEIQNYQSGVDPLTGVQVMNVQLQWDSAGTWVDFGLPIVPPNLDGGFGNGAVPSGLDFRYNANTNNNVPPSDWAVLDDTTVNFSADGSDQAVDVCPLRDVGTMSYPTCGTFAVKSQNNTLTLDVAYRDDTTVPNGTQVRVFSPDSTIQGRFLQGVNEVDDAIFTTVGGSITVTGVREGYYVAVPVDDAPSEIFFASTNGGEKDTEVRGQAVAAVVAATTPNGAVAPRSFHAFRGDAVVSGVVVNDRDQDGNTIDNNEALIGATVSIYADDVGGASVNADSLIATATVGLDGSYSFDNLLTQRYLVRATAPSGETVIAAGSTTGTYTVTTRADHPSGDPDREINDITPTTLPYWNYGTDMVVNPSDPGEQNSYFTFLFNNGTVSGTAINDETGGAASPVTIQIVRCATYDAAEDVPLVPEAGDCPDTDAGGTGDGGGTNAPGSFLQTLTAADGTYSFSGLREGVYNLIIVSASGSDSDGAFIGGLTTGNGITAESFVLFIDGTLDLEQVDFILDN